MRLFDWTRAEEQIVNCKLVAAVAQSRGFYEVCPDVDSDDEEGAEMREGRDDLQRFARPSNRIEINWARKRG